jgi:hypothetical protein
MSISDILIVPVAATTAPGMMKATNWLKAEDTLKA